MSPTEQKPDYQIAREELETLFASLNLPVTISPARGTVEDGRPWIKFTVTMEGIDFDWGCGVGFAQWENLKRVFLSHLDSDIIRNLRAHRTLFPQFRLRAAELAAKCTPPPSPAEVLGRYALDGQGAESSFALWCDEFGYDSDSIKARSIYDACQTGGDKARRILGKHFARFAELASQL